MKFEKVFLDDKKEVYFDAYLYENSEGMEHLKKRPAVVVCPGGAYYILWGPEGDPIAMEFSAEGYNTFVLHYTVKEAATFPVPLVDLSKTLKIIRERAEEWGVDGDRIAVAGFSAGGHLAASLGVHWALPEVQKASGCFNGENRPNAMILVYPVISSSWIEAACGNLPPRLAGDWDYDTVYKLFNLQANVTKNTAQAFIAHTVRDNAVPVEDSIKFASALIENGVPCELHVFPNGTHGLVNAKRLGATEGGRQDESFRAWVPLAKNWLERLFLHPEEANAPLDGRAKYISKL